MSAGLYTLKDCGHQERYYHGDVCLMCNAGKLNAQRLIYANIAQRGYTEGLTPGEFAGRQVAKLQEELGELAGHFDLPGEFASYARLASIAARVEFDNLPAWRNRLPASGDYAKELADVAIVLFAMAESLGVDLVTEALQKSAADVARGVR